MNIDKQMLHHDISRHLSNPNFNLNAYIDPASNTIELSRFETKSHKPVIIDLNDYVIDDEVSQ